MFSLHFCYCIYAFIIVGLSGSPDRKLLKQSLILATQLISATPFQYCSIEGGTRACILAQLQERAHLIIDYNDTSLLSCYYHLGTYCSNTLPVTPISFNYFTDVWVLFLLRIFEWYLSWDDTESLHDNVWDSHEAAALPYGKHLI